MLDTETKGTGAHIAPLRRDAGAGSEKLSVVQLHPPAGAESADHEPAPAPKAFKVVDVLSGSVLAEDVSAGGAVRSLGGVRKALDALVFVREGDAGRWRLLTLSETRALWDLHERDVASAAERA